MFDSKFIATLFAVAISVFAICNINTNRVTSTENFGFGGLPSSETRKELFAANSMQDYYDGKTYSISLYDQQKLIEQQKKDKETLADRQKYDPETLAKLIERQKQEQETLAARQKRQQEKIVEKYTNPGDSFNYDQNMSGYNDNNFVSTPTYQHMIQPRDIGFANVGPYAREGYTQVMYKEDLNNNQIDATTKPIDYANMAGSCQKEGFVESYGSEKSLMKPNYSEGNYNSLGGGDLIATSDLFPVQNMSSLNSVDKNGQPTQCVFFERIIHSNRNNRRRSQGDPIRGDLPIEPIINTWFNPSVNPAEDLQRGALGVIGGMSDTTDTMANFINKVSGGTITTIGGVDVSKNVSNNQRMNTVDVSR